MKQIVDLLLAKQDIKYRDFQAPLFPSVDKEKILGIRLPEIKKLAKEIKDQDIAVAFLNELPHNYFEENMLHAVLICLMKDYEKCLKEIEKFLPYVDNWGVCDTIIPKVFIKHKDKLLVHINRWINSKHTYTVRFAIKMLMSFYLDDSFRKEYMELVSNVKSEEYYINMMVAWYFATALAKQYDSAIKYIENKKLSPWVHNKTIQKSIESYRVSDQHKLYLKSLKVASIK